MRSITVFVLLYSAVFLPNGCIHHLPTPLAPQPRHQLQFLNYDLPRIYVLGPIEQRNPSPRTPSQRD
jgi:hypothetical protein